MSNLQYGSKGPLVARVQQRLEALALYSGKIDGIFGRMTKRAVLAFQQSRGLLEWLRPVLDILTSSVSETVDYQLDKIYDAVGASNQYLRIQRKHLPRANSEMDNADKDNLEDLRGIGEKLAERFDKELDDFVELLVDG